VGVIAGGSTALTRAVEGAEDHPELAVRDLSRLGLSATDILVGIATSGRTPYVISGLTYMNELGGFTIGLSCNAASELAAVAKLMITPVVGPEVISGSTRLKAGTATKLVLNTLTTGAMVRLGKTYGNLMVDLQATNRKLADRSRRIVATLTGVSTEDSKALLERAHGDVKTAVVMHRLSVEAEEARRLLSVAAGQLRIALTRPEGPVESPSQPTVDPRRLVIGVDGGGTKTLVWLAESDADGREIMPLGAGEAGASNPISVGWAAATGNIDLAIARAFEAAGMERRSVAAICLAHAGLGREKEQARMRRWVEQRMLAVEVLTTHDAAALLTAGTPAGQGIAVVSGTGSMAYGESADGKSARAGGWGYLLGDEGSGFWIAVEGLKAASRSLDGRGAPTALVERFQEALSAATPADLVRVFYERGEDRAEIAGLSRVVFDAAADGDDIADGIVTMAASELASLVEAVARQIGLEEGARFPLGIAGGSLVHHEILRERLLETLCAGGAQPEPVTVVRTPVAGAVMLARKLVRA
jgi:N-acetylglucosamine kinase-like BadF-type ATPase